MALIVGRGAPRPLFNVGDRAATRTIEAMGVAYDAGSAYVKVGDVVYEFERSGGRWVCQAIGSYAATPYYRRLDFKTRVEE